jgi:hypothetical protein
VHTSARFRVHAREGWARPLDNDLGKTRLAHKLSIGGLRGARVGAYHPDGVLLSRSANYRN